MINREILLVKNLKVIRVKKKFKRKTKIITKQNLYSKKGRI